MSILSTLSARFGDIIAMLCRRVTGRDQPVWMQPPAGRLEPAMARLAIARLTGIGQKFEELLTRFRAGTLRPRRTLGPRGPLAHPRVPAPPPAADQPVLPRRFGWLMEMLPGLGSVDIAVTRFLDDAQTQAVIAAAPDAVRRVIGPLYWMLGAHLPAALRAPPAPGVLQRALPMRRSERAALRTGRRVHAAYVKAQAAAARAGVEPLPPPLPYGFADHADSHPAVAHLDVGFDRTKRR